MGINVIICIRASVRGGNQETGYNAEGIRNLLREGFFPLLSLCGPPSHHAPHLHILTHQPITLPWEPVICSLP